jgi:hypothetical protein
MTVASFKLIVATVEQRFPEFPLLILQRGQFFSDSD